MYPQLKKRTKKEFEIYNQITILKGFTAVLINRNPSAKLVPPPRKALSRPSRLMRSSSLLKLLSKGIEIAALSLKTTTPTCTWSTPMRNLRYTKGEMFLDFGSSLLNLALCLNWLWQESLF